MSETKTSEPNAITVELFVCERCAVWKEQSLATFDVVGALRHAIEFHGNKVEAAICDMLGHVPLRDFVLRALSDAERFKGGA